MFKLHEPIDKMLRDELVEYDDLMAALLARRGVLTSGDAKKFLNPSYEEHLHDPLMMIDMRRAAERFAKAILSGEKINIWSDYDCDGIPSSVVLHDFLTKTKANFEIYIPHRHNEGYGMNIAGVEKLADNGTKLIVTADTGITDYEPIARAKELGIEVIVTDHHMPNGELPGAFAIVNPHARTCETYPFRELCGAGVVWKFICATLANNPELRDMVPIGWEKWLLDMVGLATIADMVPLIGENRVLAAYGLLVMRKSPRIGLHKLCRLMRINQRLLSEDDVGFMIAPRINAASRMGDARDAFHLFTTNDENEASFLANKLEKANRRRKAEAGNITRLVHARLSTRNRSELPPIIAMGDPEWRPALLGLVAGNIADEYERPVFLWGREGNKNIKGSVRGDGKVNVMELMQATDETFSEFGGHAAAGGFTVIDKAIFFLENKLVEAYSRMETHEDADDFSKHADAIIKLDEVNELFFKKIERLSPFGIQNPKPVFLVRDGTIYEISRFGKGKEHLKLKICSQDGSNKIDAVTFFVKGTTERIIKEINLNDHVNIIGHLERDTFSYGNPIRLRILSIHLI